MRSAGKTVVIDVMYRVPLPISAAELEDRTKRAFELG
jgi:hypothetical protein